MKFVLKKRPKNPIIIHGMPGVGLVSTIATKFLIDHLDVEEIGYIDSEYILPLTAIHQSKIINPITFYYNKKYNLVIVQSLTEVQGHEWDLARTILDVAKTLDSKEIILLESIPQQEGTLEVYYYSNTKKLKLKPISEAIIMGPAAALLLKAGNFPMICLFAEVHSQLPDSEAAAKIVEALDSYLGLKVDFEPLLEAAKKFEHNLKEVLQRQRDVSGRLSKLDKKELSYFG